jgi:hypothetical protein
VIATAAISRQPPGLEIIAVFIGDCGAIPRHLRGVAVVERYHLPSEVL